MHPVSLLGLALILLGIALVVAPIVAKHVEVERIPSWILYVYRSDGFTLVISPILTVISLLLFILYILEVLG